MLINSQNTQKCRTGIAIKVTMNTISFTLFFFRFPLKRIFVCSIVIP